MVKRLEPRKGEQQLVAEILSLADDPLAFVMFAFPWGKENTPLQGMDGPRDWQREALIEVRDHIRANKSAVDPALMKKAIASGRGIGKSALLAWLSLWLMSTVPASSVLVSANTEQQLTTTTFPEIRKWATMAIHSNWFDHQKMSLRPAAWLVDSLKQSTGFDDAYWYIQARLWNEENPDGYAGPHSQRGMAVLFDEASGIPTCIWPVAQGFFTDKTVHRLWVTISNPRNPSGAFYECFHKNKSEWSTTHIDARSVSENDQGLYDGIIKTYGADSDEARVEVYGEFPLLGDSQFMSRGEIEEAMEREAFEDPGAPLVMGVDPARFGDDEAVIRFRKGRDAQSIRARRYKRCDLNTLANHCVDAIDVYHPDGIVVEGDGVGGGLIDILKNMGYRVHEATMGGKPDDGGRYYNRRTELWGKIRDWLPMGCLSNEAQLMDDLGAPMYKYTDKGLLALESKRDMKKRGYRSPNDGDALALTFAGNFARLDAKVSRRRKARIARDVDYDIFGV